MSKKRNRDRVGTNESWIYHTVDGNLSEVGGSDSVSENMYSKENSISITGQNNQPDSSNETHKDFSRLKLLFICVFDSLFPVLNPLKKENYTTRFPGMLLKTWKGADRLEFITFFIPAITFIKVAVNNHIGKFVKAFNKFFNSGNIPKSITLKIAVTATVLYFSAAIIKLLYHAITYCKYKESVKRNPTEVGKYFSDRFLSNKGKNKNENNQLDTDLSISKSS